MNVLLQWYDLPKIQDLEAYERPIRDAAFAAFRIIGSYRYITYVVALWILLSVLVAVFASRIKGRSGIGFFTLGLLLSPVIAFLIALLISKNWGAWIVKRGLKQCERCGRFVPREAVTCQYCRGTFI